MTPELIEAWSRICRRALGRSLDDCAPVMVPASLVMAAVYPLVMELGPRETEGPLPIDDMTEAVAELCAKQMFGEDALGLVKVASQQTRDTIREYAKYVLIEVELMDQSAQEYGPVPDGLSGRELGLAALALEILGSKSPQRLIALQRRRQH